MRLLLFFISWIFSLIFYIFHSLSYWMNIFWDKISNRIFIESLSWNLIVESFLFLLIGMFFSFYFSPLNWEKSLIVNKKRILYFIYFLFLFTYIYFIESLSNSYILIIFILFLFWDFCFNTFSNLNTFHKQKINLRIFWLILNYLTIIFWITYIFLEEFSW